MTRRVTEGGLGKTAVQGKWGVEDLRERPAPESVTAIVYHIKVFSDQLVVSSGDAKWIWTVPQDMGGLVLLDVEISVTTVSSSGIVQVQLRNATDSVDMLSTRVQVDANEFHSKDAVTQPVVNTANDDIAHGDRIAVDVDSAGTGAKGLEVVVTFGTG